MTVKQNPCRSAKPSGPTGHDLRWNAGYAIEAYPGERETDLAFARGYASGLVDRITDNADAAR